MDETENAYARHKEKLCCFDETFFPTSKKTFKKKPHATVTTDNNRINPLQTFDYNAINDVINEENTEKTKRTINTINELLAERLPTVDTQAGKQWLATHAESERPNITQVHFMYFVNTVCRFVYKSNIGSPTLVLKWLEGNDQVEGHK